MAHSMSMYTDENVGATALTELRDHFKAFIYQSWVTMNIGYTVDAMSISVDVVVTIANSRGGKKELQFGYTWYDSTAGTSHVGVRATVDDFSDMITNVISALSYTTLKKVSGKLVVDLTYS